MKERVRIWDFVLIAALLAVCFSILWIPRPMGASATVSVDGKVVAVLPLEKDTVYALPDGTRVEVCDGQVFVTHATCEDKLCEEMGKISREGQTVLCIPNRISVVISGEVDAYVG